MRARAAYFRTDLLLYPWGYACHPALGASCTTANAVPRGHAGDAALAGTRCDFQFHDAFAMYDNMDQVLAYMRTAPKYNDLEIQYSLLSEYFDGRGRPRFLLSTVHTDEGGSPDASPRRRPARRERRRVAPSALNALNRSWPVRGADDFFPYASRPDAFWTGFYTSRPELKGSPRATGPRSWLTVRA